MFVKNERPKAIAVHSRRVAEACYHLAETEEGLEDRPNSKTPRK